ncbi:MAG: metallophosphoesterase [Bacteroidetes bacterium]|nr:metallophosphoesterase [Bacteroidota bacterium]
MSMRSKLLPLFLFTIFLAPEQFLISQQIKFAAIGDYGKDSLNLQAVADLIDSLEVDFIITMGDNNYNNGAASTIDQNIGKYFNKYIFPYAGTYLPGGSHDSINRFFPTAGNHDHDNDIDISKLQPYLDYFDLTPYSSTSGNERYYDFIWENVHFFAVNSIWIEPDGFKHPSIQSSWLEEQMTNCVQNHLHWRIVYFHHSPYSSQNQVSNRRWPFKEWGAHLVLSGHSHTYERLEVGGLTYIVSGLGGKSIHEFNDTIPESIVRYNDKYGATYVEVNVSAMILKFINVDGELIDSTKLEDSSLPVELVSFNGEYVDNSIILNWKTETELNNHGFELERYIDSFEWEKIAFVPGNGNSNSPKFYSYTDTDIINSSVYYYRLKQIDTDGSFTYSDEILVTVAIPKYFLLSQNYPNPFNPTTNITFSLSEDSRVKITVYNLLGEQVAELVNSEFISGSHTISFDANKFTSGIFLYRMEARNFVATKKMTLLK